MKKMYVKNIAVLKLSVLAGLLTGFVSLSSVAHAQTFYSRFQNPTGHYSQTNPTDCDAPSVQNIEGLADTDADTYAFFQSTSISEPYQCSTPYSFLVDLNMAGTTNAVAESSKAGFRIKVSTGISASDLGKYLRVATFLRDSLDPTNVSAQEFADGSNLTGIDIDHTGKDWLVYFTTTQPFNILELDVDPKIIQLNTEDYMFSVYFAFGGATEQVLPAQIANFKAAVSGKNVSLSWQSLIETNVSSYRIERSSNGGGSYAAVASVPAKGNSNVAVTYGYNDAVSVDGNYLYRIVVVNNDGTSTATSSVAAIISGQSKLLIYPTVVKSGQNITVRISENGMTAVYVYDAQGRLVKQQRTNVSGQFTIPTAGITAGIYTVKVVSASGAVSQTRIVVN